MSKNINARILSFNLSAGQSKTSEIVDLQAQSPEGYFSAQAQVDGSGTIKLSYSVSNFKYGIYSPETDILTGAVTGAHNHAEFAPKLCRYLKITATETGGANSANVDVALVIQ